MSRNILVNGNNSAVKTSSGVLAFDNLSPEYIKEGVTIRGVTGTYKGKILYTVLEMNSWQDIKEAIKYKSIPSVWLGQSKEITSGAYQGYHLKLIDLVPNRFEYASGSGYSQGVFQFVELLPNNYPMYQESGVYQNWDESYMRSTIMPQILAELPTEIQNIISEIKVPGFLVPSYDITLSNGKLFLPGEYEIFGIATNTQGKAEDTPQFQDYANNNTNEYRKKYKVGEQSASEWYLRTPTLDGFRLVNSSGEYNNYSPGEMPRAIAPCFAI